MELTPEQLDEIQQVLDRLESVDPADLPGPAAELVTLLERILEDSEPGN